MLGAERIARDKLNSRYAESFSIMSPEDKATRARLNKDYQTLTSNLSASKKELIDQIIAGENSVRNQFEYNIYNFKLNILSKIKSIEMMVNRRMMGLESLALSNIIQSSKFQGQSASLVYQLREASEKLRSISHENIVQLNKIDEKINSLKAVGKSTYDNEISAWNCKSDLIENNGLKYLGIGYSSETSDIVRGSCSDSKEKALYTVCKAIYPTICGSCAGYSSPESCPTWKTLTYENRLDLLFNMKQELIINGFTDQAQNITNTLYGGAACNSQCLDNVDDPKVKNILAQLYTPGSNSSQVCGVDEWKKCGLYGSLYASLTKAENLSSKIQSIQAVAFKNLKALESKDESAEKNMPDHLKIQKGEIKAKISGIKEIAVKNFTSLAQTVANMSAGSGDNIAKENANQSIQLAFWAQHNARMKADFLQTMAQSFGENLDLTQVKLNNLDSDSVNILSSQIMPLSFEALTEIHRTLNSSQTQRATYDIDLQKKASDQCPITVKNSTKLTLFGRDSSELLALYYLKTLITGERFQDNNFNEIYYNQPGFMKSSYLPLIFTARAFDYRLNIDESASDACLTIVDNWARETFTTKDFQKNFLEKWSNNKALERIIFQFTQEIKVLFENLTALEAIILTSSNSKNLYIEDLFFEITNKLIKVAVSDYAMNIKLNQLEERIQIQRDFSKTAGFETEFTNLFLVYKSKLVEIIEGQREIRLGFSSKLFNENSDKGISLKDNEQILELASALLTRELARKETYLSLIDKVGASPSTDVAIKNIIKNFNSRSETPFEPKITAARHIAAGKTSCREKSVNLWNIGSTNSIVGTLSSNFIDERISDENCTLSNTPALDSSNNILFRVWASAHKILFKSRLDDEEHSFDFRQPNSSDPIKRVLAGGPRMGVFEAQVSSIIPKSDRHDLSLTDAAVEMTPIFISDSGEEKEGQPITYNMTFYSPLILDFINIGSPSLIDPSNSQVYFDITATGVKENVGWISGKQGAILALDLNQNNRIDDGAELFGEFTYMIDQHRRAKNGYEALAQYDENNDGVIDSKDNVFKSLKLWFDLNANGLSEKEEIFSLQEKSVSSINVKYSEIAPDKQFLQNNRALYSAKFFGPAQCGLSGCNSYDIYFGATFRPLISGVLKK